MKLITAELRNRLLKAGHNGKKNKDGELLCQAKFFHGNYTFLAIGAEEDPTYGLIFYGYGKIDGLCDYFEYGTVGLSQLPWYIEREYTESSGKYTVKELMA